MTLSLARIIAFVVLTHRPSARRASPHALRAVNKLDLHCGRLMALFALVPALLAVRAGRWLDQWSVPSTPAGTGLMTAGALLPARFRTRPPTLRTAGGKCAAGHRLHVCAADGAEPGRRPGPTRRDGRAAFRYWHSASSTSGLIARWRAVSSSIRSGTGVTFAARVHAARRTVILLLSQRRRLPAHRPHAPRARQETPSNCCVIRKCARAGRQWPDLDGRDLQSFLGPVYGNSIGYPPRRSAWCWAASPRDLRDPPGDACLARRYHEVAGCSCLRSWPRRWRSDSCVPPSMGIDGGGVPARLGLARPAT